MTEIVHEIWKPVAGYEGLYEVSSQGRVKSLARVTPEGRGKRKLYERILKPVRGHNGYLRVGLHCDGRREHVFVHRLVCEAFHGPAPADKPFALHGNHDRADNRPENLRWGDHAENMQDMVDADRQAKLKGEANGRAKLTKADVKAIQNAVLAGSTQGAVAAEHGLSRAAVSLAARGVRWQDCANPELQAKLARRKRQKRLSDAEVLRVLDLGLGQGLAYQRIAEMVDVGRMTVCRACNGTTPRFAALRSQWLASRSGE